MCIANTRCRHSLLPLPTRLRSGRTGFTLVEIMIVIAILGILVGLSVPRALTALSKAKSKSAQAQITILAGAIEFYRLDVRSYPPDLEALLVPPGGVSNWDGPYLKRKTVPKDPWDNDIVYQVPGASTPYDLICLGADHVAGGMGANRDICLWR